MENNFSGIAFDMPKNRSNVIKVIGVGGGGSNAINYMFQQGINGVDFVICNTDSQALENSPIPNKIQLGVSLTEGLGAGANPDVGEQAAIESYEEITSMLSTNTKMVFITAGMGGGTGTGAAPVIAKMARELEILTVGIVTIPFGFEGKMRNEQAQIGVEKLRANVDSLIVINNNKLRDVYGNLGFKAGFAKADEVLATASRGIAEVITHHYTQNIDLRDAKTVLSNSGTAIMGSATAAGDQRANLAISKALDSPLLNDNKIKGAKNVLLLIVSGKDEITIDEIGEISDYIQQEAGFGANIIMGVGDDESLDDAIAVTVIATGFNLDQQEEFVSGETKKIIHNLNDDQRAELDLSIKNTGHVTIPNIDVSPINDIPKKETEERIILTLEEEPEVSEPVSSFSVSASQISSSVEETPIVASLEAKQETQKVPEKTETRFETKHIESESVAEKLVTPVSENTVNLKDIEVVDFEYVQPSTIIDRSSATQEETSSNNIKASSDEDFVIIDVESAKEIEVVDAEVIPSQTPEEQMALTFDFPMSDAVRNTKVVDEELGKAKAPTPTYEDDSIVRYTLESEEDDAEDFDTVFGQQETKEDELASFQTRVQVETPVAEVENESIEEPITLSSPISELLKARAEKRKMNMKEFNYKFRNGGGNNIDEMEKEPAYKRQGLNFEEGDFESKISRTTLSTDGNDELQLRKNNSFLHDNVD